MFNIGIIGADSSHAAAFAKLANRPGPDGAPRFPDVRVGCIWGEDPEQTRRVAEDAAIAQVLGSPADMPGLVDAVMVVLRDGTKHCEAALPFIERGLPVWVDKPFAVRMDDAVRMVRAARQAGSLLAGGSTCKYSPDVLALGAECAALRQEGQVLAGGFNFPASPGHPFGGLYFYGPHPAEILTAIFGSEVQTLRAVEIGGSLVVLAEYPDFPVTIHCAQADSYFCQIYAKTQVVNRPVRIDDVYLEGFSRFTDMLRTGRPPQTAQDLLRPVAFLNALEQALATGRAVAPALPAL